MRRLGEEIEERSSYIMYHKGEVAGQRGVGFLIKIKLKKQIIGFEGISDRIALLHLNLPKQPKKWTVIQVYSPTEQATSTEILDFYDKLRVVMENHSENNIVLMGDFNAQVGARVAGEEHIIGKYGRGKRSKNGEKLVELLLEQNLTLLNSMYRKKTKSKWTWISPDGKTRNEIDYIITNKARSFSDTGVIQNLNFNTNHRMVRSCLNERSTKKPRPKSILINHLKTTNDSTDTTEDLMKAVTSDIDLNKKYTKIENKLKNQTKLITDKSKENYLSEKTLKLIEDRKNLIIKKDKKDSQKEISNLSKQIRENMRKDRINRRNKTLENHINKTGGIRKALKELREKGKEWIPKMKVKELTTTSRINIKNIATDYYRSLYQKPCPDEPKTHSPNIENHRIQDAEDIPEILQSEIEKAINSQKMEKAPGPDRITNELLRGTISELSPILTRVFNETLYTGIIPRNWAKSHIILIHKKGPKDDIGNYRPISLISNVYKVFAKVILNRISNSLDENQPVEQAGFRKDFSTIDHIHTTKQLIQKYNEYNKPIYLAFIDYSKAFDSLIHNHVWLSLIEQGIASTYINIIKNIYKESKASIRLESTGDVFPIERGVRQGDPLSPKLFTAVLEHMFRKLDWEHFGLNINGARLSHLRFADDLVILEEDPKKLEYMIQTLVIRSREVGLEINLTKTKMMTNSTPTDIINNGQKLEYVEEYVYLGQIISPSDQMSKEIDKRIATGWKKYWALKEVMKSKEMSIKIKKKTFDTCILPCITYGCETWALTKHHRDKLERCQKGMERSMLNLKLKDRVRSADIRRKTKLTNILSRIDQLKWRWAGHMLRCNKEKWSKQVTVWYPRDGVRSRGRKARRWEDDMKLTIGTHWVRVAADRKQWKELEEAFAVRHTEIRDIL
ncbi:hypothetical protein PYW07_011838 [Mythimna separata]|uniref:Reverse transcriptase domain-containing protein n=1 Tax=Mythimna separata TaxID=271217 RepID=A0AAD8DKR2_MYTSE|nr:hypothetical protein PYW07_011838 [Mythimna separata]